MSHAHGSVVFHDGTIMFFEYNGTCDYICNHLHDNKQGVRDNWRTKKTNECTCGREEPVDIHVDYGNGIEWEGTACWICKTFVKGLEQYEPVIDNYPWYEVEK